MRAPLVSVETRDRVRAIAQQHGFEMNATARSLSRRQTNVVALATYPYEPFGPSEQSARIRPRPTSCPTRSCWKS